MCSILFADAVGFSRLTDAQVPIFVKEFLGAVARLVDSGIPVLLMVVLFGRALWRRREVEAGIWLALVTGIKLFPILFVPYLVITRRWRALASVWRLAARLVQQIEGSPGAGQLPPPVPACPPQTR